MASPVQVRLRLCSSGRFVLSALDRERNHSSILVSNGAEKLHIVAVEPKGFEETVILRRVGRRGVTVERSSLRATTEGDLLWDWSSDRPGLQRSERWALPAAGRGEWQQTDVRPGRTTSYRRQEDKTFIGTTVGPEGEELWTSLWMSEGPSLRGTFQDPSGNAVGSVKFTGKRAGSFAAWDGPRSRGSLERLDDGGGGDVPGNGAQKGQSGTYHFTTTDRAGTKTDAWRTYNPTGGYTEHGTRSGGGALTTSYVGWAHAMSLGSTKEGNGESVVTFELGTEVNPDGSTTQTTISVETHLDGSSRFERFGTGSDGSRETTYGGTDRDGNSSYSSRVEHSDGSVTITTRTVDKNGDGQEQSVTVDKDGKVINDTGTVPVGPGSAPPPSSDGPMAGNDQNDPNNPQEPAQPDHPDTGGDSGGDHPDDPDAGGQPETGMPPDDGGGEDDSPPLPRGLAGLGDPHGLAGFVSAAFSGRTLDNDEATAAQRVEALLGRLSPVAEGDGGDIDDGVGEGIVIDMPLNPPPGNDGEWGDITNPRALLAFAGSLMAAMQGIAGAGNLIGAVGGER